MLDLPHIPNALNGADIQIFNALGANDLQTWVKPRGKSFVYMFMIGGGAGGGGGFSAAAATARGGGGGGASGTISKTIIPAVFLPDNLYIRVPIGGAGGASGVAGSSPVNGFVSFRPDTVGINSILQSQGTAPGGGGAGSAAAVGVAGTVGTASSGPFGSAIGLLTSNAGVAGGAGGAVAGGAGTSITYGASTILCSGAGGAGTTSADFAGGNITGAGWVPANAGGAAGSNRGNDGVFFLGSAQQPFASLGGSGGGSSNTGVGGSGGNGAIGCGGGGGGGGTTGGAGGRGGDGLVIIACW